MKIRELENDPLDEMRKFLEKAIKEYVTKQEKHLFNCLAHGVNPNDDAAFASSYSTYSAAKYYAFPAPNFNLELHEGEYLCKHCNGWGQLFLEDEIKEERPYPVKRVSRYGECNFLCDKCRGHGKLDWVSNVTGQVPEDKVKPKTPPEIDPIAQLREMKNLVDGLILKREMITVRPPILIRKDQLVFGDITS
jgi:hypothetical protein